MVRCRECDLVFVDRPPSQAELAESYHEADFDSAEEAEAAADTYARAIDPLLVQIEEMRDVLEIGTGTGAFLQRLSDRGIQGLVGVEPSRAALRAAPPHRHRWIREGIFERSSFAPESFDLICCFMTLEHVREPGELVEAANVLLRPGGAFASVTHDYRGFVNRVLGRKSPIIDIEHMQLFSTRSARELLVRRGYVDVTVKGFRNSYSPNYWLRLSPLPAVIKRPMDRVLHVSGFDRRRLALNVGNLMTWGFKPALARSPN